MKIVNGLLESFSGMDDSYWAKESRYSKNLANLNRAKEMGYLTLTDLNEAVALDATWESNLDALRPYARAG